MDEPSVTFGYVNAHTHLYSGLGPFVPRLHPSPTTFVEILERFWWRLDRALDARSLRAAARFYVAEALLRRTTGLIDHHESPGFIEGSLDVLADACQELGMRAVLCYGATERNGGREEARRGLAECRRFILSNRRPLVRGMIGIHASFTVSDATLEEAGHACRELGTALHVHLAEDRADVDDAMRRGYRGPLERLIARDALPPGSILAHGVHLDESQVRLAEERGCWLVQNPRSNEGNRVGFAAALDAAERVALGTDGYPSSLEFEALELARIAQHQPRVTPPERITKRLECGRLLIAERFGSPPGPLADDTVEHDARKGIFTVKVGGRPVVRENRLVHGDPDEIAAEARAEAPRLGARMKDL